MKTKWNWLDTTIVCVLLVLIIGACLFFFWPRTSSGTPVTQSKSDIYVTFDTHKSPAGTFDALKVGDEVRTTEDGKVFGVIDKIETLPSRTSVFNEETKQYDIYENELYPIKRIVVKTTGYRTDRNEVYAVGKQVRYTDSWSLETPELYFYATVCGVEGGKADA